METLLTEQLNELLSSLNLPFALQSPAELTPSLLLAVLEAILDVRIPIDVHDPATRHIQTIKVFLGVLETDIIRSDVGLSQIDPRLLAAGEWDEVVFVAEVLCWIGKELGLIHDKSKDPEDDRLRSVTPSPSSTITFLPPFSPISPLFTPTLLLSTADDDTLQTNITSPLATSSPHHHHKTHSHIPPDDSSFTRQSPPIRRTGHISLVDHDSELSSYLTHSLSLSSSSPPQTPTKSSSSTTTTPSEIPSWQTLLTTSPDHDPRRTYQLLQQRTQLMEELLHVRMTNKRHLD
ncbi:hypothetical protein AGABI1DRAFT_127480 [Agaricus bisporus var. burnettii JB137-S8]|uniref:DUF5745 domain-containing protein n=1 Tax=Agaricus bisporus var. burnettii (strain JB137-S8 / ATCC MYA-4627 / FGSC 10392) TaxID=597362 RepID=K5X9T3_AGABU|nr:uncharacterized protein AGABI1DRAFT_127480 [Agaricus bisporus var. burnettii JB137-S8]EKM79797.1 hypothetical protein AGABI1DRAFT_127480 [Agaricus bisporus var. burnettii JB137-S8]